MPKEWSSPYYILSRKSTSSVPMSVKGRNVSTLGGISSSSSPAVTELISSSRRLTSPGCKVIGSSVATMRPSSLGFPSAGNSSVPYGKDCAVLLAFRIGFVLDRLLSWDKWVRPGIDPVAASVTSFLLLPNVSESLFVDTLTLDECVESLTFTFVWCVSCISDGCVGEKSVGVSPK